jgi:hypothetical protein
MQLDGRRGHALLQVLDISGDVDGLHVAALVEVSRLTPGGKVGRRLRIGLPSVRVANVGGEKLEDALGGPRVRSKESGQSDAGT